APATTAETPPTQAEQAGTQEARASQETPIPAASPNTAPEALPQVPPQDPAPAPETPAADASAAKSSQ
ncbi:aminodeoxychorismate lyase, partial [Pseudomonas jessenii]